jgi:glycosyltransferase involved in cell wall biosynthesis
MSAPSDPSGLGPASRAGARIQMPAAVSLVIATYNHARYLADALDSAVAQTRPAEVVVVDDGSTDDTPAVLARYGDRVRVHRQPNRGLAAARNAGLTRAGGAYVGFLDADDVLAPAKLARQAAILDAEPSLGWTYCDVRIEDEVTGERRLVSEHFGYAGRRLDGWLFPELVRGNFIPAMAPLIRREALAAAGPFDESLPALEDWDLWLRLSLVAPARHVAEPLATYRLRPAGLSRDRARMDRSRFLVLDKLARARPDALRALGVAGRRIVADTHNWFADQACARGDWREARRRLAASVRTVPWQGRAPRMLALSALRAWRG